MLGTEKGADTETRLTRNFGMARPEGYRKARRLMRLADRFGLPVLTFVDTAGAYPGIDAEARGQAEAIARAIETCLDIKVPLVAAVIGEGGSGGAIALAAGNAVLMLEHAVYSVISPEGCASILWRDGEHTQEAAEALRLTAQDLLRLGVIDRIVPEPLGGAHRLPEEADRAARRGDRRGVAAATGPRRRQIARATPRKVPRDGRSWAVIGLIRPTPGVIDRASLLPTSRPARRIQAGSEGLFARARVRGADALRRRAPLFPQRKADMTPQERDLLTTLLARLKNTANQPKDPEADALIRQAMAEQPDAPYFLAQTVLIQDLSLHNAQNQIAELEKQLTDAQQQAARPAPTSFLGGLFGSRQPAPPASGAGSAPPAGPWTRAPQVAAAPPAQPWGQPNPQGGYGQPMGAGGGFMGGGGMGGSGFLRSAATTAAGIAGGALLFQGIESLFGQHASAGILGGGR